MRDRVLGLHGLLSPVFKEKLRPDYSKSVYQVYRETFLAYSGHAKRLGLLQKCYLNKSETLKKSPSWMLDLSDLSVPTIVKHQFAAGFSRCYTKLVPESPNVLTVMGVRCTTIKTIRDPFPKKSKELLRAVRDHTARELAENEGSTYVTGEPFKTAFSKTVCCNYLHQRLTDVVWYPTLESWLWQDSAHAFFGPRAQLPSPKPSAITDCETNKSSNWYEADLETRLWHRRYVTTHEGFIGIGPPDVQEGDIICVFLGFDTPVVLRPLPRSPSRPPLQPLSGPSTSPLAVASTSDKYLFVGPVVIYGLHDSLSLLGPLPTPWRVIRKDGICAGHDDSAVFQRFRNQVTGDIITHDPRMSPEVLRARDVPIREFVLV